jgi:hypothetical protein
VVETNLARLNICLELCETVGRSSLGVFVGWLFEVGKLNVLAVEQPIAEAGISKE